PEIPAAGAAAPAVAAPGGAAPGGAAAIPPLPAGLNPADYYWCEQCKAYHQREPGAQPAAHPAPPADLPPADPFAPPPLLERPPEVGGTPGTQVIPPLPAGLNPADYQWDAESKSYRLRRGG
nr:hypothetical protein [Akkermansiaceae bacterium]